MIWASATWPEIGEALKDGGRVVLLPVGATEQHGPHMGCGMDTQIGTSLCEAVAQATGALLLPSVPYGCSLGHSRRWPGTIAISPTTLIDFVVQIGSWAHHSGARRLFLVNSHVGNAAPLRCALEVLRAEYDGLMVALLNTPSLDPQVRAAHFDDAEDWHANDAETSLMLARAPELVRPDLLAEADDEDRTAGLVFAHPVNRTSRNGVTGAPSQATPEKGETLFAHMVEALSDLVRRGSTESPPLDQTYHTSAG